MHICIYIYIYIYFIIVVYTYAFVYIYIYTYTYAHTYIHTYIHILRRAWKGGGCRNHCSQLASHEGALSKECTRPVGGCHGRSWAVSDFAYLTYDFLHRTDYKLLLYLIYDFLHRTVILIIPHRTRHLLFLARPRAVASPRRRGRRQKLLCTMGATQPDPAPSD